MRSHRVARVRRKGGRHEDIVLAPRTDGALDDYLEVRGDAATSGMVTRSGERGRQPPGHAGRLSPRPRQGGGGDICSPRLDGRRGEALGAAVAMRVGDGH
jgi:hypothetical protein